MKGAEQAGMAKFDEIVFCVQGGDGGRGYTEEHTMFTMRT